MNLLQTIESEEIARLGRKFPIFAPGDTIIVNVSVVEGVVVRGEGFSRCTAWNAVQHWCFNFQEACIHHRLTDRTDSLAACRKSLARLFGHDEVNIALAVT